MGRDPKKKGGKTLGRGNLPQNSVSLSVPKEGGKIPKRGRKDPRGDRKSPWGMGKSPKRGRKYIKKGGKSAKIINKPKKGGKTPGGT